MPGNPAAITKMAHYHVIESNAGCLPEAEPYLTDDPGLALDMLAQMFTSWAETDASGQDATQAAALAGLCQASPGDRGEAGRDALARLSRGHGICHAVGLREFEIQVCQERDCLKYCPAGDCRTVTAVTDPDPWCWSCGTSYAAWDACPWLE